MRTNLAATRGLIVAEAVMRGLAPHLDRTAAHDLVSEACRGAIARASTLRDVLDADPRVRAHLSTAAIARLCDPANYLGVAPEMVDRVLAGHRRA